LNILTLDFETFFSDDYTLKKMTTEAYVRDPRFEVLGVGLKFDGYPAKWYDYTMDADIGASLPYRFDAVDWNNTAVLMHHAHFDGLILSHHYGIKPKFILDTLSMARLMLGNHISVGLESLARHYGLDPKSVPYDRMRGCHWADMDTGLRAELAAGCLHDVSLTWDIFCRLMRGDRGAV
jgi:hypothetical protein